MTDNDKNVVPVTYRTVRLEEQIEMHENRITQNEKFRLQAQGALAVIVFALGTGGVTALLLALFNII